MTVSLVKRLIAILLAAPAVVLFGLAFANQLGPDPGEVIARRSGEWALQLLLLCLTITPLRVLLKKTWPIRFRRMLGLYAFFYACLHVLSYLWFYAGMNAAQLLADLTERPYIIAGASAWLLMLPLALTSTTGMQRRLGKHWRVLHRLVYAVALLGIVHLAWQLRSSYAELALYAATFTVLMLMRSRTLMHYIAR